MAKPDLFSLLSPDPPRAFPGRRGVKVALRAVHVLCAGVLAGAWIAGAGAEARATWLLAAVTSGGALLAVDLHESAVFLVQVRGLVLLGKLAALGLALSLPAAAPWILAGLVLASVLSSHAPSRVRYRLLVGRGRLAPSRSKG